MIINCPCGEKSFEVDSNLIPNNGRMLQCGICEKKWFFNINHLEIKDKKKSNFDKNEIINPKKKDFNKKDIATKGSEIIKYKSKSNFTFFRFLSYLLVTIISFVGLILLLDTFKSELSFIYPNLESLLFSLYETLKDIKLFAKDLI